MAETRNPTSNAKEQVDFHHLYRHFDKDGRLLYVGISLHAILRLTQHRADSHWFDDIATTTIKKFKSKDDAIRAEVRAIRHEKPLYNISRAKRPDASYRRRITTVNKLRDGEAAVRQALKDVCNSFGSQKGWAFANGFHPSFVTDVLSGRRDITERLLEALDWECVCTYRPKPATSAH